MFTKIKKCLIRFGFELTPPIIKKAIKKLLVKMKYYQEQNLSFIHESVGTYSQCHEDLFLDAMLSPKQKGFYVDIGANHPEVFSNTKRFYNKGWNGINVEPIADNFKLFEQQRTRDVNLNVGVGSQTGEMVFYHSAKNGGIYSGFDKKNVRDFVSEGEIEATTVPVLRLQDIFYKYVEDGTMIDFLSIDVEGYELEVLNGNDWSKFRPHLVVIELAKQEAPITEIMRKHGYNYIMSTGTNGIFIDSQSIIPDS